MTNYLPLGIIDIGLPSTTFDRFTKAERCDSIWIPIQPDSKRLQSIIDHLVNINDDNTIEDYVKLLETVVSLIKTSWLKGDMTIIPNNHDTNHIMLRIRCYVRLDEEIVDNKKEKKLFPQRIQILQALDCDASAFEDRNSISTMNELMGNVKNQNNPFKQNLSNLANIYATLDSPRSNSVSLPSKLNPVDKRLEKIIRDQLLPSFKTKLYQYQRNSLWKMMKKELSPQGNLDLDYLPWVALDGTQIYVYLRTFQLLKNASRSEDIIYGGILCENMGAGKTITCLALVMQTLDQVSFPKQREFIQFDDIKTFIQDFQDDYLAEEDENSENGSQYALQDLVESSMQSQHIEEFEEIDLIIDDDYYEVENVVVDNTFLMDNTCLQNKVPSLSDLCSKQLAFECSFIADGFERNEFVNLLTRIKGTPPYFFKDMNTTRNYRSKRDSIYQFPPLKVYLSKSTLVLTPDNLIQQWQAEIYKHLHDNVLTFKVITDKTEEIPPPEELVSFNLILMTNSRFRRENKKGGFALPCIPLKCQCNYIGSSRIKDCRCAPPGEDRYISPLLQVEWLRMIVDEGHSMGASDNLTIDLASKLNANHFWACTGTPMPFVTNETVSDVNDALTNKTNIAFEQNQKNYSRLKHLICRFLRVEPFHSQPALFDRQLNPTLGIQKALKLRSLMNEVMVRNQQELIDNELPLPPCYEDIKYLSFNPLQSHVYNLLIAFLKTNMVLTQREGPDYIIQSPKLSQQLLENLRSACFWVVTEDMNQEHLRFTLKNIDYALKSDGIYTEEDLKSLGECKLHIQNLMDDPFWVNCFTLQGDLFYQIQEKIEYYGGSEQSPLILKSNLKEVQVPHLVFQNSTESESQHLMPGQTCMDTKHEIKKEEPTSSLELNVDTNTTWMTAVDLRQKIRNELESSDSKKNVAVTERTVLNTTSSKLSYLMERLKKHQEDCEKTLIFCQFNNEIANIHEACHLSDIKCMQYHRKQTWKERAQSIVTFNTTKKYSTMIMDLKSAAFGIDLSTASRIYFTSPVNTPAEMKQAIKRAHRNGCQKPVYVETLVIKDSLDEVLLERQLHSLKSTYLGQHLKQSLGMVTSLLFSAKFVDTLSRTNYSDTEFMNPIQVVYGKRWEGIRKFKEMAINSNSKDNMTNEDIVQQQQKKIEHDLLDVDDLFPDEIKRLNSEIPPNDEQQNGHHVHSNKENSEAQTPQDIFKPIAVKYTLAKSDNQEEELFESKMYDNIQNLIDHSFTPTLKERTPAEPISSSAMSSPIPPSLTNSDSSLDRIVQELEEDQDSITMNNDMPNHSSIEKRKFVHDEEMNDILSSGMHLTKLFEKPNQKKVKFFAPSMN